MNNSYFAGLFDGEGSVTALTGCKTEGPRHTRVCIRLSMADPRPIQALKARFGGGVVRYSRPFPYLTMYSWYLYGINAKTCLQLLAKFSLTKKTQARLALQVIRLTEKTKIRRRQRRVGSKLYNHKELQTRIKLSRQIKVLNRAS